MANAVSAPGSNIAPFKTGANVRFPPFAHSAYGCLGDRRRGQSVENAPPLSLRSGWGHPDCVSIHIIGNRPPLDQWHGVDGVIHALSTATIPSQSSRGGQRVDNPPPPDELGRCPFGLSGPRRRGLRVDREASARRAAEARVAELEALLRR